MRFILAALLLTMVLGAGTARSQPDVSNLVGVVEDQQTVTITGSGFGIKSPAAPLKWDDFESGAIGTNLTGWSFTGDPVVYSTEQTRAPGHQSAYQNYTNSYARGLIMYPLPAFQKMYVSGWWYNEVGGAPSRNFKLINWSGGAGHGNATLPQCRTDMYPSTTSGHLDLMPTDGPETHDWGLSGNIYSGEWMRIERFMDVGTPGSSNGETWLYRNLNEWASLNNVRVYNPGDIYTMLLITHYFARDTGTPTPWMKSFWDELYIDITPARVELGNASTWDACTRREIQIPSAWSQDSLTFTVNQGAFTPGQTAYVYVVNAAEEHNATGFPLTIGTTIDPGDPPGAPGQPAVVH
jgi:hypothetical protein